MSWPHPIPAVQVLSRALCEEWQGSGCLNLEQQNLEVTQEAWWWGEVGRRHGDWNRQRTCLLSPTRYTKE